MRGKKRLWAQEFDAIRPHLKKLKENDVHANQEILVGGRVQKYVRAELKLSKGAVSRMAGKVRLSHIDGGDRPKGRMAGKVRLSHIDGGDRPKGSLSIAVTSPSAAADMVTEMAWQAEVQLKAQQSLLVKP